MIPVLSCDTDTIVSVSLSRKEGSKSAEISPGLKAEEPQLTPSISSYQLGHLLSSSSLTANLGTVN